MATNITAITGSANSAAVEGAGQFQGLFDVIPFQAVVTDASLAAQVAGQCDVTVTGAALGDLVLVSIAVDTTGVIAVGAVTAANTVTVTTYNLESVDANTTLSAGPTLTGVVLKPKGAFDSL
jgi:hypothetical protein